MCPFAVEALTRASLAFPKVEKPGCCLNKVGMPPSRAYSNDRPQGEALAISRPTSGVDQRRIQSGPYAGQLEWGDRALP
jgi:hypothetical protein